MVVSVQHNNITGYLKYSVVIRQYTSDVYRVMGMVMLFSATFSNITVISWISGENHRSDANH